MGKCTGREKYTAVAPNKTTRLNSEPGRSESATLPPGGTRDHVQCLGPRGLADPGAVEALGRCLTLTRGRTLITHPSPQAQFLITGHSRSGQFP